jgi:hypothetical protein
VFAPASPDAAEDDGYVMAFVHDPDSGATDLVLLAGQDFTGEPVARMHLPVRVPLGFYGNWIGDQDLPPSTGPAADLDPVDRERDRAGGAPALGDDRMEESPAPGPTESSTASGTASLGG